MAAAGAGSPHPDFLGAGAKAGLEIWRIENKVPVRVDETQYGKFYSGDSYICLKTKEKSTKLEWDIHFWIGEESSTDEMGIAAYKTVELDDSLGGGPVQYRETQERESDAFLALFKKGVTYLTGGVDSGFVHVDRDSFQTRLLHLKGRRRVRVRQVEAKSSSLNSGDVFVLDCGRTLYQWNGSAANKSERAKGLDVVLRIRDEERSGRAEVVHADEGSEPDAFWEAIGGKGKIKSAQEAGGDEESDKKAASEVVIYKVTFPEGGGDLSFSPLPKVLVAALDPVGLSLLDCGQSIFVWVGKRAPKTDKSGAMKAGMQFLAANGREASTPLQRVVMDGETPIFKDFFPDWPRPKQVPMDFSRSPKVGNVATALHQMSSGDLASSLTTLRVSSDDMDAVAYGDGSGTLEVFRVANFKLEKEEVKHFGHFYAGDSYVMLYSYLDDRGRDAWVIYFWLGRHSSIDEIGTAALEAKRLDDERGGTPVQVRVVQNKEPTHLLRLFKGKFIVFNGGNPSAFRRAASAEQEPQNGQGLFHVRGTTALNTRAVQVSQETSSLNSSDVFVLMEAERALVWYGRMCSPSERTAGLLIGESLCGSAALASPAEQVEEGSEPDWFWQALGGKGEYAAGAPAEDAAAAPRLFHGSNASGVFSAKEIADFAQEDLLPEDVYILDIWSELFVWIGPDATEVERAGVESLAQAFTQRQGQDRQGTPISTVLAGKEPRSFTCHFLGWDDTKAAVFEDPYEKKLLEMKSNANNSSSASAQSPAPQSAGSSPWGSQVKRRTPQQQDPLQETPPSTPEMPSLRSRATPSPQPASQAGPSPGGNPFGHVVLRKSVPPPDFSPTAPNAPNASEGIPAVTLRSPKLGASPTPPAAHTTIPTVALRAAKAPSDFAPVIPPPPGGTPPLPASGASPPSASASSVAERAPRGVAMGAATAQRSAGNYGGYGGPSLPAGAAAEEARPQLRSVSLRAAPATDKVEGSTDAAEGIAMPQLRATGRAFQELGKTPPAMGDEASSGGPADLFGAGRLKKTEVGKATAPAGGDHESGGGQQDPFGAGRLKKTGRDLGERKPPSMPAGATNDVSRAALRAVAPPSAVAAPGDAGSAAASPASAGTPDAPAAAPPVLPPPPATTNSPPVSAPPQNQELGAPAAFTNRAGAGAGVEGLQGEAIMDLQEESPEGFDLTDKFLPLEPLPPPPGGSGGSYGALEGLQVADEDNAAEPRAPSSPGATPAPPAPAANAPSAPPSAAAPALAAVTSPPAAPISSGDCLPPQISPPAPGAGGEGAFGGVKLRATGTANRAPAASSSVGGGDSAAADEAPGVGVKLKSTGRDLTR